MWVFSFPSMFPLPASSCCSPTFLVSLGLHYLITVQCPNPVSTKVLDSCFSLRPQPYPWIMRGYSSRESSPLDYL